MHQEGVQACLKRADFLESEVHLGGIYRYSKGSKERWKAKTLPGLGDVK